MNCPECGNPVEKQAAFCPKCYARIEPPRFWRRLLELFKSTNGPSQPIVEVEESVVINMTDEKGQHHEYHSLDELPPEVREAIRRAQTGGVKRTLRSSSSDGRTTRLTTTTVSDKTVSVFKVQDQSGNEQVYYSLEEMPPEIRAAFEQAENQDNRQKE